MNPPPLWQQIAGALVAAAALYIFALVCLSY
jgi:hypothetical protein